MDFNFSSSVEALIEVDFVDLLDNTGFLRDLFGCSSTALLLLLFLGGGRQETVTPLWGRVLPLVQSPTVHTEIYIKQLLNIQNKYSNYN